MSRLLMTLAAAAPALAFAAVPEPAAAQQNSIAEIIVYGNDPCPRSTNNEIYVCNRRPEAERYRIPQNMRQSGTLQEMQSWAVRSKNLETVGATGINSCSPVGPGGYTGCLTQVIREAREQRQQQNEQTTPPEQ
jgi:hypothetical protein